MDNEQAWKKFEKTGSIFDYLLYRSLNDQPVSIREHRNEAANRSVDNKNTERRG